VCVCGERILVFQKNILVPSLGRSVENERWLYRT